MKLKKAREVIEDGINQGLHPGAQLSVAQGLGARREEVNLAFGEATDGVAMTNDTLCLWLSCSKPLAAVAIGILWERDKLSLDDQVKHYIPEFAQHGKDVITIRHILTHTGGFRMADQASYSHTIKEALELVYDSKIEPRWHPGQKAGYHSGGSWLILGELIQRIDGRAYQTFVRQEIFEPLEMHDCWVGIPQDRLNEYEDQLAVMYKTTQGDKQPHPQWERSGEIVLPKPGSHGRGPARELRKFYDMLMEGGELDGVR
ncbi:MAG: serine hydrolase domain-containing protein, partial [Verrucomicrobiota bacterium]